MMRPAEDTDAIPQIVKPRTFLDKYTISTSAIERNENS